MCVSVTLHWLMLPILVGMLYWLDMSPEAAWAMLVVTVKLTATVFLLLYFWLAEPSWMVLASAVGDAIMGAAVIVTYYQYRGGFPTPRATSKWNG